MTSRPSKFIALLAGFTVIILIAAAAMLARFSSIPKLAAVPSPETSFAPEPHTQTTAPAGEVTIATARHDLDDDGKLDQISLSARLNEYGWPLDGVRLSVNGESVSALLFNPEGDLAIVDLDRNEEGSEVAISDDGPSGDPTTSFYGWDGTHIVDIGRVSGMHGQIVFNGDGGLQTVTRGRTLDTWFHKETFRLEDGKLKAVPQAFYERMGTEFEEHRMLKPLALQKSPTDVSIAVRLIVGEKVTIVGCDEIRWCKVRDANGKEGWFALSGFNTTESSGILADEYLSDLSHAD